MSKTSTELSATRSTGRPWARAGRRCSTRRQASMPKPPGAAAPGRAVDEVDAQMSTWKPDSDLMRLNRAPSGEWVRFPQR